MGTSSNPSTFSESLGTELSAVSSLMERVCVWTAVGSPCSTISYFGKGQPRFVAFDLLHSDGQDLTCSPLVERKQHLRAILPRIAKAFYDHIEAAGEELFALDCKNDLKGIVAKHKFGPYLQDSAQGRREKFFEREREVEP